MSDSIAATDPACLGLAGASTRIARRALPPVALTGSVPRRIAALDGGLPAPVILLPGEAPAATPGRGRGVLPRGHDGQRHLRAEDQRHPAASVCGGLPLSLRIADAFEAGTGHGRRLPCG